MGETHATKRAAWTLVTVCAATAAGVWAVHEQQKLERKNLRKGVERDRQLLAEKQRERRGPDETVPNATHEASGWKS